MHKVDLFICIDKRTRDRIKKIYNVPSNKLEIIPTSQRGTINCRTKRKSLAVGLVGRIFPHKGHEFVINCFRSLPENEFNLIIVGQTDSDVYASSLVQKTRALKYFLDWPRK